MGDRLDLISKLQHAGHAAIEYDVNEVTVTLTLVEVQTLLMLINQHKWGDKDAETLTV